MIGYLEGTLLKKEEDRILVLIHQIGYEVLVAPIVMAALEAKALGDPVSLYIYHHQTERQPKPVLIGFTNEAEKEFFQQFLSVEDIGPLKAVRALTLPVREVARAIEAREAGPLRRLKGIGERTAQKIIAALAGKMERFIAVSMDAEGEAFLPDVSAQVLQVLVEQLGHRVPEAKRMIAEAMDRNQGISTPEELIEEVFRSGSVQ